MEQKPPSEIRRLIAAWRYSRKGLKAGFAAKAFRMELLCAAILIPVALHMGKPVAQRAILVASVMLVLIIELLNTAIEVVVDRISTEQHPLSGRAKDLGSAAVFLCIVNALLMWMLIAG